jgi:hypothetical protein
LHATKVTLIHDLTQWSKGITLNANKHRKVTMNNKTLVLVILASVALIALMLSACAGGSAGLTVTTSTDFEHNHKVTIPSSDLNNPPDAVVLTTTEAGSPLHSHTVRVTKHDIGDILNGQLVFIVTSRAADGHNHAVTFVTAKPTVAPAK